MSQNIVTTNKAPQNPIQVSRTAYNSRVSFTTHMCPGYQNSVSVTCGRFTQRGGARIKGSSRIVLKASIKSQMS